MVKIKPNQRLYFLLYLKSLHRLFPFSNAVCSSFFSSSARIGNDTSQVGDRYSCAVKLSWAWWENKDHKLTFLTAGITLRITYGHQNCTHGRVRAYRNNESPLSNISKVSIEITNNYYKSIKRIWELVCGKDLTKKEAEERKWDKT